MRFSLARFLLMLLFLIPVVSAGEDDRGILEGVHAHLKGDYSWISVGIGETSYLCQSKNGVLRVVSDSPRPSRPAVEGWAIVGYYFCDEAGRRTVMGPNLVMQRRGLKWEVLAEQGTDGHWSGSDRLAAADPPKYIQDWLLGHPGSVVHGPDRVDAHGLLRENAALDKRIEKTTAALRAGSTNYGQMDREFRSCLSQALDMKKQATSLPKWEAYKRLLDTLRLQVRRCEGLVRALDHEQRYGVEAAKPLWASQLKSYRAYQEALSETKRSFDWQ